MAIYQKFIGSGLRATKLALALGTASLALQGTALAQDKSKAPDPPIKLSEQFTPISYSSSASDVVYDRDKSKGDQLREGTLLWSQWWYYFEQIDGVHLVGILELSITPNAAASSELEDFRIKLEHGTPGCIHKASKPEPNSEGIQLSGSVTKTPDGVEIGGGIAGTVLADGLTITAKTADKSKVNWTADIPDGSGTAKAGAGDLIFYAEWHCPTAKGTDLITGWMQGNLGFDVPGFDTDHDFSSGGWIDGRAPETHPEDGTVYHFWGYSPKLGWCDKNGPLNDCQRKPNTQDNRTALALTGAPASEQRLARLNAISGLRTTAGGGAATPVTPAGAGLADPSAQARSNAYRMLASADSGRGQVQAAGGAKPQQTVALAGAGSPVTGAVASGYPAVAAAPTVTLQLPSTAPVQQDPGGTGEAPVAPPVTTPAKQPVVAVMVPTSPIRTVSTGPVTKTAIPAVTQPVKPEVAVAIPSAQPAKPVLNGPALAAVTQMRTTPLATSATPQVRVAVPQAEPVRTVSAGQAAVALEPLGTTQLMPSVTPTGVPVAPVGPVKTAPVVVAVSPVKTVPMVTSVTPSGTSPVTAVRLPAVQAVAPVWTGAVTSATGVVAPLGSTVVPSVPAAAAVATPSRVPSFNTQVLPGSVPVAKLGAQPAKPVSGPAATLAVSTSAATAVAK